MKWGRPWLRPVALDVHIEHSSWSLDDSRWWRAGWWFGYDVNGLTNMKNGEAQNLFHLRLHARDSMFGCISDIATIMVFTWPWSTNLGMNWSQIYTGRWHIGTTSFAYKYTILGGCYVHGWLYLGQVRLWCGWVLVMIGKLWFYIAFKKLHWNITFMSKSLDRSFEGYGEYLRAIPYSYCKYKASKNLFIWLLHNLLVDLTHNPEYDVGRIFCKYTTWHIWGGIFEML